MGTVGNTLKTLVLLLVPSPFLLLTGALIGGVSGIAIALVVALAMNGAAFWGSDSIALRMYHAREVSPEEEPDLHQIVDKLVRDSGLPKPRVHIIDDESPNAFATGRSPKRASVAATRGIIRMLNREELEAVMGHELAHVGNRDTLIMTVVAVVVGAVSMIAWIAQLSMFFGGMGGNRNHGGGAGIIVLLVVVIVMPIVALMVRSAISRTREYQADAFGARLSGNPEALARALEKLEAGAHAKQIRVSQSTGEATAHLFIVNPLSGREAMSKLFTTHPPISERARRLRAMVPEGGRALRQSGRPKGGSPFA
jgi:heat shock protein HtpX